jgi:hypothetical protein
MKCPSCGLENPPNAQYCDCKYDFVKGDASRVEGLDSYLKLLCVLFPFAGILLYFHYKGVSKKKADQSLRWTLIPAALYILGSILFQLGSKKNETSYCTRQYTVAGKVTDDTGKPVPNIAVDLGSGEAKTAVDGSYKFTFKQDGPPKKIGGSAFAKGFLVTPLDLIDETAYNPMNCTPMAVTRNVVVYPSP